MFRRDNPDAGERPPQEDPPSLPEPQQEDPDPSTYTIGDQHQYSASVGARVGAVLTTAERAAEEIVRLARDEAQDLLRQAEADSEARMRRRVQEAEEEARTILDVARAEAEQMRRDAERETAELERSSEARRSRLGEETRLLRERIEWAREGLGDLLTRLDELRPETSPWHAMPQSSADDEARVEHTSDDENTR
jgi:cell division septum initiation protein DivIVA